MCLSLLELFHRIYVQAKLAQSIFPLNIYQHMSEHVKDAIETLGSKNWTGVAVYRGILSTICFLAILKYS
jgi:hypothetical protein